MARKSFTAQGRYRLKNPEKYNGNKGDITYRSSWEKKCMIWLDNHPAVIEWSSEEIKIPYLSPVDNKYHRYFPDFYVVLVNKQGERKTYIWEVKPEKQTRPPKKPKRKTKQYLKEVQTWGINEAKWNAAIKYCEERGWEFKILTEENIGF